MNNKIILRIGVIDLRQFYNIEIPNPQKITIICLVYGSFIITQVLNF